MIEAPEIDLVRAVALSYLRHRGHPVSAVLATALAFARHGHAVFPVNWPVEHGGRLLCSCGGDSRGTPCGRNAAKHPYGKVAPRGLLSATTDTEIIMHWFGDVAPQANLGLVTDRLVVLDIDPRHTGDESFKALKLAPAPNWLIGRLAVRTPTTASSDDRSAEPVSSDIWSQLTRKPITEYRDMAAAKIAGHFFRHSCDYQLVLGMMHAWNSGWCQPPLGYRELNEIVARIANREAARIERELAQ